jgi:enterobactin synthetase component F
MLMNGHTLTTLLVLVAEVLEDPMALKPDDNFFDVGGDSLVAVELAVKVEEVFGKSLGLDLIFESENFEALGRLIDQSPSCGQLEGTDVTVQSSGSAVS